MRMRSVLLVALSLLLSLLLVPFAVAYGVTFYNPAWNPQDGKVFELVEPNQPYEFIVKNPDIAVTKLVFRVNAEFKNAGITVYNLRTFPSKLPENSTIYYELNELKYVGFVPKDTVSVDYYLKVNKTWLQENAVSRDTVAVFVYRSPTDSWAELPTVIEGDDASFVYYKASDKGVHYLYIGRSASAVAKAEPVREVGEGAAAPSEKGASQSAASEAGGLMAVEKVVPAAPAPQAQVPPSGVKGSGEKSDILYFIVIVVVFLFVFLLVFARKKPGSVDSELNEYVKESLKHGKSMEDVKKRLLEVGWHPDRVAKVLSRYKGAAEQRPAEKK